MKNIVKQFIQYPFLGKLIIFVLISMGLLSVFSLKKSSFPEMESTTISIRVGYPKASASEMEIGVTALIENALRGIPGIKETSSVSMEGSASVTVTAFQGEDMQRLLTEVKNAVDGISNFPGDADKPTVSWQKRRSMAMFVSLYGDVSLMELKKTADHIEDELLASGVISQVSISGVPSQEISIEIRENDLRRYQLTFTDLQNAIAANNLDMMGGTIRNPREEITITSRMRTVDPEKFGDIIVRASVNGSIVRIKDVATVTHKFAESPMGAYANGKPQLNIQIQKLVTEDLVDIGEYMHGYIEDFNEQHDNMKLEVSFDFRTILQDRLGILTTNGIIGVVLVIVMLSLFLNFRLSLWVAWGIPASFLGMFIIAYLIGITINMISLFGMIMVIGILVDDGVVIGENVYSHFEKGKSPWRAAYDGTIEVLPAIFTSVSTTMIAFVPLLFLSGMMSMMYEMAIVVIASLALSIFEGIFVLPGHLSHPSVLDKNKEPKVLQRMRKSLDSFLYLIRDRGYLPLLRFLVRHKWVALTLPVAFLLITAGLLGSGKIGITFFPNVEDDYFTIDLALKPGTSVEVTKAKLAKIEAVCQQVSEEMTAEFKENVPIIEKLQTVTGSAFSGNESGTHAGNIYVFLKDIENVQWSVSEVKHRIAAAAGEMPEAYKFAVGASTRWGAPFSVSLMSRNEEQLLAASEWLKEELRQVDGLYNVLDNNQLGGQEIRIRPKEKAYILGLTQRSLMAQVQQGFFGGQAQRLVEGKNEIRIYARYPLEDRQTVGDLEQMHIRTSQGEFPLYQLAEFEYGRTQVAINRYNGKREIRVEAYQKNPQEPVSPIIEKVNKSVLNHLSEKFPTVNYMYQGQVKNSGEDAKTLISGFGVAFLVIFLVIMLHFKSVYQGMLVIMVIPLGWISAIWGHGIEGAPLSLLSMFGLITLSGTIINDAVVYLARFNQNLEEGMSVLDAVLDAGHARFRPILLTSVTTTVGLYPLILETSMQAQFLIPMAIALAYGIFIGTFFILLFLPLLVLAGNDIRRTWKSFRAKSKLTPEEVEPHIEHEKHKALLVID